MQCTRDERPRLVLEFENTADRQEFFNTLLLTVNKPDEGEQNPWRLVENWNLGGQ